MGDDFSEEVATPFKLQPLPTGWEEIVTPEGRRLYIDHINKQTTWLDPRDDLRRARAPGELPFGWTIEYDEHVGTFFMNLVNRFSTKIDPRTGVELPLPLSHPAAASSLARSSSHSFASHERPEARGVTPRNTDALPSEAGPQASPLQAYRGELSFGATSRVPAAAPSSARSRAAAARKLEAIREEFEENDLLLQRMRDDARELLRQTGIARHMVSAAHQQARASPWDDFREELPLSEHMQRLRALLSSQLREVEVLRRLQAGLLTDNLSPTERLAQMDDATYDALVSVLVPATAASQRRLKLEYFGRLSHAIGSA